MKSLLSILKGSRLTASIMHNIASPMVIGLAYHGTTPDRKMGIENFSGKHIDAKYLEKQLRFIARNYRVIKQSELVDRLVNRKPLPRKAVFITFDDGYVGNYHVAFPLLKKYGLSATFFVPTVYIENGRLVMPLDIIDAAVKHTKKTSLEVTSDGRTDIMSIDGEEQKSETAVFLHRFYKKIPFEKQSAFLDEVTSKTGFSSPDAVPSLGSHVSCMTWDHLREMIHGGMEIGSHTHHHIILSKTGDKQVDYELSQSKMLLEKNLGQPCPLFCYPNGHYPESGNDFTNSFVKKAGYSCATFMCGGINHPWTDPYFIARRAVGLFTTMTGLRITLTSLGPRIKTIFGEDPSPHAVSLRLIKAKNREDDLFL